MRGKRTHADIERVGGVDGMGRLGAGVERHEPNAVPRVATIGENPRVGRVARRVQQGAADGAVVGVVPTPWPPRVPEVDRHDDLGPVPTDLGGKVGTQCQSLDDRAVGPPEERHLVHAHDGAARLLLAPPDRTGLGGIHRRDPRFAVRHEDVGELLALPGPSSNGRGRAVLHVVGMRDHREPALPVLGKYLECHVR